MSELPSSQNIRKVYAGRQDNVIGRMEKEIAVYDLLDKLEISYDRVDHEVMNMIEECNGVEFLPFVKHEAMVVEL